MFNESVIKAYINEPVESVAPLSGGHINQSFLVTAGERFVLQQMNHALYASCLDAIANNYGRYRKACPAVCDDIGEWYCPEWLRSRDGDYFHTDAEGNIWRMYRYIPEGECEPGTDETGRNPGPYEAGRGLGKFHRIMKKCEGIIAIEANTALYDLSYHYRNYCLQSDPPVPRKAEFDHVIERGIDEMLAIRAPEGNIIHGDAKAGNMIFDKGAVVGMVDLDTIMPGSVFNDLADCARSCCLSENGGCDPAMVAKLVEGYEEGAGTALEKDGAELVEKVLARNMFMLGMRYYTDYLAGGSYFADLDPGRKLERARDLLMPGSR